MQQLKSISLWNNNRNNNTYKELIMKCNFKKGAGISEIFGDYYETYQQRQSRGLRSVLPPGHMEYEKLGKTTYIYIFNF